jgi:hypothetical protein
MHIHAKVIVSVTAISHVKSGGQLTFYFQNFIQYGAHILDIVDI